MQLKGGRRVRPPALPEEKQQPDKNQTGFKGSNHA
jgi:hypothetical protein